MLLQIFLAKLFRLIYNHDNATMTIVTVIRGAASKNNHAGKIAREAFSWAMPSTIAVNGYYPTDLRRVFVCLWIYN